MDDSNEAKVYYCIEGTKPLVGELGHATAVRKVTERTLPLSRDPKNVCAAGYIENAPFHWQTATFRTAEHIHQASTTGECLPFA
eukprot:5713013-Amphidinium_carterae.1